jgi:hypothetical protein
MLEAPLFHTRRPATPSFGCDRALRFEVCTCSAQFRTPSPTEPPSKCPSIAGPIRGSYARSDRWSANCRNPQPRASSDATAQVGALSAREGSGADASMVAIDR